MKNLSHIVFLGVIAAIFISVPVLTLMDCVKGCSQKGLLKNGIKLR